MSACVCVATGILALFNSVITTARVRTDTRRSSSLAWGMHVAVSILGGLFGSTHVPEHDIFLAPRCLLFPEMSRCLAVTAKWFRNDIGTLTAKTVPAKHPCSVGILNVTLAARFLSWTKQHIKAFQNVLTTKRDAIRTLAAAGKLLITTQLQMQCNGYIYQAKLSNNRA